MEPDKGGKWEEIVDDAESGGKEAGVMSKFGGCIMELVADLACGRLIDDVGPVGPSPDLLDEEDRTSGEEDATVTGGGKIATRGVANKNSKE